LSASQPPSVGPTTGATTTATFPYMSGPQRYFKAGRVAVPITAM
jgi:hypothetical protein